MHAHTTHIKQLGGTPRSAEKTHAFGSREAYRVEAVKLPNDSLVKQAQPTACHDFEVFSLDGAPGL